MPRSNAFHFVASLKHKGSFKHPSNARQWFADVEWCPHLASNSRPLPRILPAHPRNSAFILSISEFKTLSVLMWSVRIYCWTSSKIWKLTVTSTLLARCSSDCVRTILSIGPSWMLRPRKAEASRHGLLACVLCWCPCSPNH